MEVFRKIPIGRQNFWTFHNLLWIGKRSFSRKYEMFNGSLVPLVVKLETVMFKICMVFVLYSIKALPSKRLFNYWELCTYSYSRNHSSTIFVEIISWLWTRTLTNDPLANGCTSQKRVVYLVLLIISRRNQRAWGSIAGDRTPARTYNIFIFVM